MRKNLRATVRKLRALEARRTAILATLMQDEPLLAGSLSRVNRTCGKPGCHCATTPGHPAWTLATTADGRRRCQVVRRADVETVARRVAAYKNCKRLLTELAAIESDERTLIHGLIDQRHLPYA